MAARVVSLLLLTGCVANATTERAKYRIDLGIAYLNNNQCTQAEESCRLGLEYGESAAAHNCLGLVAPRCRNDLDAATKQFKTAVALDPELSEPHNNLGAVFFRQDPPQYEEACDEFRASIEIDPDYCDGRENFGMCLMRQGKIRGDQGDTSLRKELYESARSQLYRLLEICPRNFNAHHHLGFMDMDEQRPGRGEAQFMRCLEIDPENPTCCYNLGFARLQSEKCAQAIPMFVCAMRGGPESEVAILAKKSLGAAYAQCAVADAAVKKYFEDIKSAPGNPVHHYDLGAYYEEKGLIAEAVNEWEITVKLDPGYCPAYFDLATVANRSLDTPLTVQRCQAYVGCEKAGEKVELCKALVKKLEME